MDNKFKLSILLDMMDAEDTKMPLTKELGNDCSMFPNLALTGNLGVFLKNSTAADGFKQLTKNIS